VDRSDEERVETMEHGDVASAGLALDKDEE
jgi:hypothetical protein